MPKREPDASRAHTESRSAGRAFGLPLEPFYPAALASLTLLRGKRIKTPTGRDIDMAQVPLELTRAERRVGLSNLGEHYFGRQMRQIGESISCRWPAAIIRLGEVSFAEFLRSQGASRDAIHYLAFGFEEDSALDMLRDAASHHAESFLKIRGGNDRLPRAFAGKLSDQIQYGCPVQQIDRGGERLLIHHLRAGPRHTVQADQVMHDSFQRAPSHRGVAALAC
jgi:monoamine oxidase